MGWAGGGGVVEDLGWVRVGGGVPNSAKRCAGRASARSADFANKFTRRLHYENMYTVLPQYTINLQEYHTPKII